MKFKAAAMALLLLCSNLALARMPQGAAPKGRIEGTILKTGAKDPLVGVRVNVIRVSNGPTAPSGAISASFSQSGPPPPLPPGAAAAVAAPAGRGGVPAPPPLPTIPSVVTDRDGKFVIPDLDAGSYRVAVVAPSYVKQEYGQRVFPGQGTVLTLTAGQVMKDLVMNLTLAGNVSGRLRDSSGQPASGVPIQLLKPAYNAGGQKSFSTAGTTRTNDRGEYRIYWVTPGRYYVAAGSAPGPGGGLALNGAGAPATPNDPGDNYLFSFYPGATDAAAANSIEVTSGNEVTADFLIPRQQIYTVRGRAIDATTNQPPASLTVTLSFTTVTGGGAGWSMGAPYNAANGNFEIRDIVPGSYTLQVYSPGATARMPLEVTNNIEALPVVLGSAITMPGRIVVDGLDQTGVDRLRVQLRAANNSNSTTVAGATNPDGTFKIENLVPGEYRIVVTGLPDYFIKEARFDANDVFNQPLKIAGSIPGGATLEVSVSPNAGQVSGVVTDEKAQPVPGVQAVLVPDKNRDRSELFKTATTDQTGRFLITSVTPGDYKLLSWEALESFGYFDPELLKKSEPQGKPVHVGESSKQQIDVRVIPASK